MLPEVAEFWPLVWTQIWQISVLAVLATIAAATLGRRWPHLAYALWIVVLVKCFAPPIGNWPTNLLARMTPQALLEMTPSSIDSTSTPHSTERHPSASKAAQTSRDQPTTKAATTRIEPKLSITAATWLLGSCLLAGIAIGTGRQFRRQLRRNSLPAPPEVDALAAQLAQRLRLSAPFLIRITSTDEGPLVVGQWRPTIYLPELLLSKMELPQLEAVIAHELVHIRRRDSWVALLQFAAQVLWWFHPFVWWMNRQLVRERERSCDEETILLLNHRRAEYARSLLGVLEARQRLEPLWGYPAVRPVELTRRRMEEIMQRKNMKHSSTPIWCVLAASALALLLIPGAGTPRANAANEEPASTSTAARPVTLLKYGDGRADGKKSFGGNGQMIRFELPEGVTSVRGIKIHGSRYGLPQAPDEDFEITFLNDNLDEILGNESAPYRLFKRGREMWVRVNFAEPIELPSKFWVALNFNAHQTKGVYLSYDTSTKGEYSRVGLAGSDETPKPTDFGGDWMVQVMLPASK